MIDLCVHLWCVCSLFLNVKLITQTHARLLVSIHVTVLCLHVCCVIRCRVAPRTSYRRFIHMCRPYACLRKTRTLKMVDVLHYLPFEIYAITLSHTRCHAVTYTLSHCHIHAVTLSHTHCHIHAVTLSHIRCHAVTYTLSRCHIHAVTLAHTLSHSHIQPVQYLLHAATFIYANIC
jgi:hypothetical protein